MAHTLRKINFSNSCLAVVVITDYVAGGEAFTLAELGITGLTNMMFILDGANSDLFTGAPSIFPQRTGGIIKLVTASPSGTGAEIPSQVGINYMFAAIVQGT